MNNSANSPNTATTSRDLSAAKLLDHYATNRNDLISEFYGPCLDESSAYDRAVGYFSSSLLILAAEPVAAFAERGGRIRLICSPELTTEDITALETGYQWRRRVGEALKRLIDQALDDPVGRPAAEFLATLIAVGCLDIRIAFRVGAQGIFHDKVGIFKDYRHNTVSFIGSINETRRAWDQSGNHESFDVFCSWTTDRPRVERHASYFDSLWNGDEPGLETIAFPNVARDRLVAVANPDGIEAAYAKIRRSRASQRKRPQAHQLAAIESWRAHGGRGILQHATGSGKTFTAITAMREHLAQGRPVLVVVPSELLLNQWDAEVREECGDLDPRILLVAGGYDSWRRPNALAAFTRPDGGGRVVIATLQTASSDDFLNRLAGGDHLMLVVDEVHRAGSARFSRVLTINAGPRLGLSATPQRYGDPDGTARILSYFDGILQPPFTLLDAIAAGRLCQYNYHVHTVELTNDEQAEWLALSKRVRQEIARAHRPGTNASDTVITDRVKLLLIRRSRIVKQAAQKPSLALDVIRSEFAVGQRWLVYCDDQGQLSAVLQLLRAEGFPAHEYHSSMVGDRQATFEHFAALGGILVAIKCLDEGVDIPSVDHALILASSRNPREFIQRRGRVLRTAPDKFFAEVHDVLVLPPRIDSADESDGMADGMAILRGELARAIQFASGARNDAVRFQLRQLARDCGLDPEGIFPQDGYELDEED